MPIHKLKLLNKCQIAKNTIEFVFEKPDGLQYVPGQYAGFTLINPTEIDAGGITRRFSLASTPDDAYLTIAMRIQTSAFKRVLNTLPIGSEIKFAGPTGNFTLHTDAAVPAVFIAGGIGITPFYSMIKHATQHQSQQKLFLFYGNQTIADAAYLEELTSLQQQNPNFTLIPVMANPEDNWQGETGYITHTLIKKFIPDIDNPVFYVCGSPAMVTALQETLAEMGVNEEKIKIEDFPGY